ncbi:U-box domain-containing protein 12-like [Lotus japonicus]|uniref:U-box domain-containing protein 12-like n=1 Tax=Lotus japonicus TaxID=34305 RepID=UPI002587E938|nr:U-box domain-containing protein 12-like [Lotus japonicus]
MSKIGLLGGIPNEIGHELIELGAVPVLVELLRTGDQTTKLIAANSLHKLSSHTDQITKPFSQAGAIPLFDELLQGPDPSGKRIVGNVLSELAVRDDSVVEMVGHLVRILKEGDDESKAYAANMMWVFSGKEKPSYVIRESGTIHVLVELLGSGIEKVLKNISKVVAKLSYDGENRMALVKADAIPILMDLLHHKN